MRIQQERAASTEQARPVANAEDVMSIKRRRHIYETRRGVVGAAAEAPRPAATAPPPPPPLCEVCMCISIQRPPNQRGHDMV